MEAMKRPAIAEIDRQIMRELPDTFCAQQLKLALAGAKLKREIVREGMRLFKWKS
jgi:hypothetical protein